MTEVLSKPEIVLDLSRLLSRVLHATPTGVDRCEMAYARGLLAVAPDRLNFAAVHPAGMYGRLSRSAVLKFLDATEERWEHRGFGTVREMRRFAVGALSALRPRRGYRRKGGQPLYIQASPNNLTKPNLVTRIVERERARFFCLVHDLIPLQYPEYARPGGAADHEKRIRTILSVAEGIICNSQSTLDALQPWMAETGRFPKTVVAHLGTHVASLKDHLCGANPAMMRPYFVSVGTIEPRKNHLLLLNIWRKMASELKHQNFPKLILIGRRGWENEQVVDMLERCPALVDHVEEFNHLPDEKMQAILSGARALLLPSFAEGYGMPVAEALSWGVPVICSDLAALREAGGDVPDFLDPLDGRAWSEAICDYADDNSVARDLQLKRMRSWRPPTWHMHIDRVIKLADGHSF